VEVAGIEPASLKVQQRATTCLALYLVFSMKALKGELLHEASL